MTRLDKLCYRGHVIIALLPKNAIICVHVCKGCVPGLTRFETEVNRNSDMAFSRMQELTKSLTL